MSGFVIVPYGGTTMNVSLTPQLEAMIRQRVESGRYNNASEVVREALRLLEEHEQVMHLRSLLAVGLKRGSSAARNRTRMSAHRSSLRLTREADRDLLDILLYTRRNWG